MMNRIFYIAFAIILISTSSLKSQEWVNYLPSKDQKDLTFYDYQNAFNEYWAKYTITNGYYIDDKGIKQKAAGWKQFKRWEYYWERRVDSQTGTFPEFNTRDLINKYYNPAQKMPMSSGTDNWTSLGPNASDSGYAGVGRINCVSFHPSDNNTFWVGTASGGIWKTSDGGSSWTVLNNGTGVLAVSDILIPSDYATSNTIYIATGDRDGWDNRSIGVLKSTDGGITWNATDLSYTVAQGKMVSRLLVDPSNDQTIIAATKDGVYKTTDGGTNWNTQLTSERFLDIEYKPGNFNTLYGGTKYDGEVWRSIDGGANWTNALNTGGKRVEVAVSANDANVVYALVCASDNSLFGVYKSTDSGASFSLVYDGSVSCQNILAWDSDGCDGGGQGWYDLSLEANPSDADMVFVGGVNTWKSTNGGSSFSIINHWWGDGVPEVHADKHKLRYRSNGDLFECNDGGIYISEDDGVSWTDKTNGMVISQLYKIGVAQTVSDDIIAGLQDNGTKNLSGVTWSDVIGGDGMDCAIDYTNEDVQYGELHNGDLQRTTNHWGSYSGIKPSGSSGAWVTPFVIDPSDHNTLYGGYEDIYKSTNQGSSWTTIYNLNSSDKFRTLAVAPSNTDVIYAGEPYTLWKSTNGGGAWTDITSGLPGSFITYITVKDDDENTLWVTLSTYSGNSIYESTNGGSTWTNISTGLPDVPVNCIVQNKLITTQTDLFAGTDNGVYYKEGTANWASFNNGLPNVDVSELEIYYDLTENINSLLRAGTYGRGVWETPIYDPIPPDPNQSKDIAFSDITTDKMTVSWTNGTGTNRIVKINTTNSFSLPVDGTDPTANTVYGGGEQVVFNGSDGSVTITSLDNSTTYYFRIFDYEGSGAATVYNVSPGINNPDFSTTYCLPSSSNIDDDYIKRFMLNTIDNTSGETEYSDFTSISTPLLPDNTYDVSVEVATFDEYLSLWIDWNDNQIFETSEKLISDFVCPANTLTTAQINIPSTNSYGNHILRTRVSYYTGAGACGSVSYGEAEDYTINFKEKITWTGVTSTDWMVPTNWDVGKIPSLNYEVIINNSTNQPKINTGQTAEAKKVNVKTGSTLTIDGTLNIIE